MRTGCNLTIQTHYVYLLCRFLGNVHSSITMTLLCISHLPSADLGCDHIHGTKSTRSLGVPTSGLPVFLKNSRKFILHHF